MTDEFNETPWTERQWEEFLRESELRSARFGELFETLLDHPRRDELIAREMGWNRDREAPEEEPAFELPEADEWQPDEEDQEEIRQEKADLSALPAYSAAFQWGLGIHKLFENVGERNADLEEIISRAIEGGLCVGAKIAAGRALGDDDETLCGNIVCCKRAAAFARQAIEALQELADCGGFPGEALQGLIEEGNRVQALVEERIRELRSRVWWE